MTGTGPGEITEDGCAVEFYARIRAYGEPELVHAAVPAGAGILELGAGTGRLTGPLLALGHPVLAVDFSDRMLARIPPADGLRTRQARMESLRLAERFDAVLLASHFANVPDDAQRRAILATCRAHLAEHGQLLVQWHPPSWAASIAPAEWTADGVGYRLREITRPAPDVVAATVEYRLGAQHWSQSFAARCFDPAGLAAELATAGLVLDRYLTEDETWFTARPG